MGWLSPRLGFSSGELGGLIARGELPRKLAAEQWWRTHASRARRRNAVRVTSLPTGVPIIIGVSARNDSGETAPTEAAIVVP
jgi:hypothetical protein